MKRFSVIGLGHFGLSVAKKLYQEGREVIAIDSDKEQIQEAVDFSEQAICTDATDKKSLEAVGLEDIDVAIVSLGERMDVITLAALHLKEIGVPYLIVKAISADHEKILKAIGVDEVVHPEEFAAQSLATRLSLFGISNFLPVLPDYSVVLLKTPACFLGKTIASMESRNVQVVGIERKGKVILSPSDAEILDGGDMLILLGENRNLNLLAERIEKE